MKRTFPKQQMLAILWDEENASGAVLLDEIIDTSRWSIHHYLVFSSDDDEKLYATSYSVGATEMQDEHAWEDEDVVECVEVEALEVVIVEYVPV